MTTLVETNLSNIKIGTTNVSKAVIRKNGVEVQIRPTPLSAESIVYVMKAGASGNLYAPTSTGVGTPSYNWDISIDGGSYTNYSGTATSGGTITIGTGYTPNTEHTIIIKPYSEAYGWAKAFNFSNVGIANLLTQVIYDGSYMGYASSATNTGNEFRAYQYNNCTSLTVPPAEYIPDTVLQIGENFRKSQYEGCISLTMTAPEVVPSSVREIRTEYRLWQYSDCNALSTATISKPTASSIYLQNYRGEQFYYHNGQRNLSVTITGNSVDGADDSAGLTTTNCSEIRVPSNLLSAYQSASNWSAVSSLFVGY